ncbi:hypothetical protein QBC33DRAFT_312241 [Phialemonium atrogriseum]|uniref:Uncharacterized protein n=1 Tax=Phialemonium atrogriseum TaxID=1093897 RepID=A0AAJ0C5Z6_9PEZI|nr:uncharacterized protein QBC33DRAFT_312241 [Phialemonium atrogriseum]KAK1770102.1 hypothetical protein QBC33DRAFT_312241 [Phialemonium atrogriseum]
MARLPPAEKLPLAVRKNVRDEWDNNKADIEKQLSDLLGEAWTFEVNPNAIWPYHNDGYAKDSLGSCIKAYFDGAIYQIKYLIGSRGDSLKAEINTICSAHVLSMDVDDSEPKRFSYGGCDVADGKLRLLFRPDALGTNIDYACQGDQLFPALNAAPGPEGQALSFLARMAVRQDYDGKIEDCRKQVADMTGNADFKLDAKFEDVFAKLQDASKVASGGVREGWQERLGSVALGYFEALAYRMKYLKVAEDEMVREGFNEAVEKGEAALRIVDKLTYDSYCECVIEDGVLYLQTTPQNFGTNIDNAAQNLMDLL